MHKTIKNVFLRIANHDSFGGYNRVFKTKSSYVNKSKSISIQEKCQNPSPPPPTTKKNWHNFCLNILVVNWSPIYFYKIFSNINLATVSATKSGQTNSNTNDTFYIIEAFHKFCILLLYTLAFYYRN